MIITSASSILIRDSFNSYPCLNYIVKYVGESQNGLAYRKAGIQRHYLSQYDALFVGVRAIQTALTLYSSWLTCTIIIQVLNPQFLFILIENWMIYGKVYILYFRLHFSAASTAMLAWRNTAVDSYVIYHFRNFFHILTKNWS